MRSEKRCEIWIVRQKEETHPLILGRETLGKCRSNHLKEKKVEENAGKHLVNVVVLFYALFSHHATSKKVLVLFSKCPLCCLKGCRKRKMITKPDGETEPLESNSKRRAFLEWIFVGWIVRKIREYFT